MQDALDLARLLARAERAFGPAADVTAAIPRRKAIVFVQQAARAAADAEVDEALAQAAVDKLRRAEVPTAAELTALEACIRFMRPAWLVKRDRIVARAGEAPAAAVREAVEGLLRGVCAIVPRGQRAGIGTGFLVGPRALVTNRHVLRQLSATEALDGGEALACFGFEADEVDRHPRVPIARVGAVHPGADVAVLELAEDGPHAGLPLSAHPTVSPGAALVVVGYPAPDQRTPLFARAVFGDLYGVKRAAFGEVTGGTDERLYHDASTLGGNSGSPVIDLASATVIGVHTTGHYAHRNEAVLASLIRVEGEGCSRPSS